MEVSKGQAAAAPDTTQGEVAYFSKPIVSVALLSFFTFGIYDIYWFYKNWKAIKEARSQKISPLWRAIFRIFFAYSLFKEMLASAEAKGYKQKDVRSAGLLAAVYIVAFFASNVLANAETSLGMDTAFFAVSFIGILPLLVVQSAANYHNAKVGMKKATTTGWEKVIIVLGFILFFLVGLSYFLPAEAATL